MASQPDKAVILAAGLGTRMRRKEEGAGVDQDQAAVAETGVKAMIPIDRPFLDYVLHEIAAAGYREVCLVIGPEHEEVRRYYEHQAGARHLSFSFAVQEDRLGTAHALLQAEAFADGEPFIMLNSDNYYPRSALAGLRVLEGSGLAVFDRAVMLAESNIAADRLVKFAVVEPDDQGRLRQVIEKPDQATIDRLGEHAGLSLNCWRFSPDIFEACKQIEPSARGEYEITDAVQYAIDTSGEKFQVHHCREPVLDMSSQSDIPTVAEHLRDRTVAF